MKIYKEFRVANAVLALVELILSGMEDEEESGFSSLMVEMYANGREHGYQIHKWDMKRAVCFSENRNSDTIVVYRGGQLDFQMAGNIPSQAVYEHAKHFPISEIYESAMCIVDWLTEV